MCVCVCVCVCVCECVCVCGCVCVGVGVWVWVAVWRRVTISQQLLSPHAFLEFEGHKLTQYIFVLLLFNREWIVVLIGSLYW